MSDPLDRLPPHALQAEQGMLGCVISGGLETFQQLSEFGMESGLWLYDHRHQLIYDAMLTLASGGTQIDFITVSETLRTNGKLEKVQSDYLSEVASSAPSAANLSYYAEIVREKFVSRRIIQVAAHAVGQAYDSIGESEALLSEFESEALSIRKGVERNRDLANIREIQMQLTSDYESAYDRKGPVGIPTGFIDLDQKLGGLMAQEMIVIGGLRSTGKTSLALNIIWNIVSRVGIACGFVSLETSAKKVIHRIACAIGQLDGSRLLTGHPIESDLPGITKAFALIARHQDKLLISDAAGVTPANLMATCRRMYQRGARVFAVDYLQLIDAPGHGDYEKATACSKLCKRIAKEFDVPVIVLASLNRESDKADRDPKLSDLRSSGQIEYDCDKAVLLSIATDPEAEIRSVTANVAKNKDGRTGKVNLIFFATQFLFKDGPKVEPGDIPPKKARKPHAD